MSVVLVAVAAVTLSGLVRSSAATADTVTPTSTSLTAAPATLQPGEELTLTAVVAGTAPGGSVSFTDGTAALGTVAVASGQARLVVALTTDGVHDLTATYSGDGGNAGSQGSATVTVNAPAATVPMPKARLRSSASSVSVGDKVSLTWITAHATRVRAGGDWSGSMKPKGTAWVRVTSRGRHVYSLTASNARGTKTVQVVVTATRKAKAFELSPVDGLVLPGAKVPVETTGLAAGESYTVRLGATVLGTGKADHHGAVDRAVVVPRTTKEGSWDLTLTGSNPSRVGTTTVTVIVPVKALVVTLSAKKAALGDSDGLTVTGLVADEPVTVDYAGVRLSAGVADATGRFTYNFDVGDTAGKQTVTVTGAAPGRTGQATVKVAGAPPVGQPARAALS